MKDYETLAREKNEEIKFLTQKLIEIQRTNKSSFESEIHKLSSLLCESEFKLDEKEKELDKLKGTVSKLKGAKKADLKTTGELKGIISPGKDVQRQMKRELSHVYKEIISLSKAITTLLKGDEPNMHLLLGEYSRESREFGTYEFASKQEGELTLDDLEVLKKAIHSIRRTLCDYYAERYSNECNIQ